MAHYKLLRTGTADPGLHRITLSIAKFFLGVHVVLERLNQIKYQLSLLAEPPLMSTVPGYMVLRGQGYKVLILEKDLVFYTVTSASHALDANDSVRITGETSLTTNAGKDGIHSENNDDASLAFVYTRTVHWIFLQKGTVSAQLLICRSKAEHSRYWRVAAAEAIWEILAA